MKILDAIASGLGQRIDAIGGAIQDPIGHIGDILDENEFLALMQDPAEYEKFLTAQIAQGGGRGRDSMLQNFYQPAPMVPTGGFMNQMPNYMNTDQLILSGLY